MSAIFSTTGNKDCHIILRGGKNTNYQSDHVSNVSDILGHNSLAKNIMIDASHANSQKNHSKQKHIYTLEEFGLTPKIVEDHFKEYIESKSF